jgi:flotillin
LYLLIAAVAVFFVTIFAFLRRYRRCPSDKILVVYGKIARGRREGLSAKCYHGGAAFIWPVLQAYQYLDLTPMAIDIKLEGALSKQNIRVNTPSTFTVGISTEPGVMENAAERLLELSMPQVSELARDIIFGQMRVVLATMPIEEINADRDKLIDNITSGVEVELKKIGLRLINVNIQDITDESGYIDALGKEAAARAINEAKVQVAEKERDGEIGSANAARDRRIQVSSAHALAVEGENKAQIQIAQSNAARREQEAEAERRASAAEKVKQAQALGEAYEAEEESERQRAKREEATQRANVVVPAEIKKQQVELLAEAEAEKVRRLKKGEADGLRSLMEAEAEGLRAILSRKAEGFDHLVGAAKGLPELASLLMITEQLPKLVAEQVKAISNLKIDCMGGRPQQREQQDSHGGLPLRTRGISPSLA